MAVSREEILSKVLEIVADKLSLNKSEVTEEATLQALGADSLDIVELIMCFEEEFNIEIDDDEAETVNNVAEAVNQIYKKLN